MNKILLALLAVIIPVLIFAETEEENWLAYGNDMYAQKNYQKASVAFKKVLSLNPKNFEALVKEGSTMYALNDNEKAADYLEQALAINSDPELEAFLAKLRPDSHMLGRSNAAAEPTSVATAAAAPNTSTVPASSVSSSAITADEDQSLALIHDAYESYTQKKTDEALDYFQQADKLIPDQQIKSFMTKLKKGEQPADNEDQSMALIHDAYESYMQKNYSEAVDYFQQAENLIPDQQIKSFAAKVKKIKGPK